MRRIPTYNMSSTTFARAAGAAIVAGVAVGGVWAFFNAITLALLFIIMGGLALGYAIGEAVSLATNRKAGPPLQLIAVGGVVIAYVVRTGLLLGLTNWGLRDLRADLGGLIVTALAGFIAVGRLR